MKSSISVGVFSVKDPVYSDAFAFVVYRVENPAIPDPYPPPVMSTNEFLASVGLGDLSRLRIALSIRRA